MLQIMRDGNFDEGSGKITAWPQGNEDYYNELKSKVKFDKKLKVVVDSSAAISALFVPKP